VWSDRSLYTGLYQRKYRTKQNRFFVQGDPKAILVVEFLRDSKEEILEIAENGSSNAGKIWASFSNSFGEDTNKVWTLRKAGLGLLSNIPGDAKQLP
jgi:hypothetical protein